MRSWSQGEAEGLPRTMDARTVTSLLVAAGVASATAAEPASWEALPGESQIVVRVLKKGLLSAAAHDHEFLVRTWHATATFDARQPQEARVEMVLVADSLVDRQPALSPEDREKVNRQAVGPDVLDARRYPEIRFVSTGPIRAGAAGARPDGVEGEIEGTLSVRGVERRVSGPIRALRQGDGWHVQGSIRFKQSDFGIEPYSGFLGTIAVHDEVEVVYDVLVGPARGEPSNGPGRAASDPPPTAPP
jgi:polyisoprenoid-binding protein YceI